MYNYLSYYDLDKTQKNNFFNFLKKTRLELSQPSHVNMWDDNWTENPNTLPFILEHTTRFLKTGSFSILYDRDKIVACSGCYISDFSPHITILGCRTWIDKSYRNLQIARNYLLPSEKSWAINNQQKIIMLTFNQYNKNLIKTWTRKRLGENREAREPKHFGYNGINTLDFPLWIKFSKQWVIYEKLDKYFDFNWEIIKSE